MTENTFGLWAGTAINDTSSVVAAGYIFSDAAGAYATIVKLTRTTMIIPIALIYVAFMASKKKQRAKESGTDFSIKTIIPWFVLWFLGSSLPQHRWYYQRELPSSIDMAGEIPDYHGPRRSRTASGHSTNAGRRDKAYGSGVDGLDIRICNEPAGPALYSGAVVEGISSSIDSGE